jgi:hypothetical protein
MLELRWEKIRKSPRRQELAHDNLSWQFQIVVTHPRSSPVKGGGLKTLTCSIPSREGRSKSLSPGGRGEGEGESQLRLNIQRGTVLQLSQIS